MPKTVKLECWGPWAAFNRPEMKVERVSYEAMTPSAARGFLEAIYWKPQMRWVVDEIRVLRPIRFTNVRRNEIASKIPIMGKTGVAAAMKAESGALGLEVDNSSNRAQRAAMILRDVRYGIEAHVEVLDATDESGKPLDDAEAKHLEMFKRRASRGQYFHHPYFGVREFTGDFELVDAFLDAPEELLGERDLGFMLHDIDFVPDKEGKVIESHGGTRRTAKPHFFRALMRDGVLRIPPLPRAGEDR